MKDKILYIFIVLINILNLIHFFLYRLYLYKEIFVYHLLLEWKEEINYVPLSLS